MHPFSKVRFQVLGALFFAVFIPAIVRAQFDMGPIYIGNLYNTIIGMLFAVVIGCFFYRKIILFPGVNAGYYIIPIFTTSYVSVVMILFFFRFDYTRSMLAISFVVAIAWFHLLAFITQRSTSYRLAIVPGGQTANLTHIRDVKWVELNEPQRSDQTWDGVVADLRADLSEDWERFIADVALSGIPVFHVKEIRESLTGRVEIEHLSENTLGSLIPNRIYLEIKQTVDWVLALVLLVLVSPLFLVIAALIKIDTPGPVLFSQIRRGYRGRNFVIYKFRTMNDGSDSVSTTGNASLHSREYAVTKNEDPRITRVGKYLRRTRLDELPQLINILRSEMSWIGPRPEAFVLSEWYEAKLPFYIYRHIVHPGITGWAQVNQGHVAAVEDVRSKLQFDFYYIKNFSVWLDFLIVLKTIQIVFTGYGAR